MEHMNRRHGWVMGIFVFLSSQADSKVPPNSFCIQMKTPWKTRTVARLTNTVKSYTFSRILQCNDRIAKFQIGNSKKFETPLDG